MNGGFYTRIYTCEEVLKLLEMPKSDALKVVKKENARRKVDLESGELISTAEAMKILNILSRSTLQKHIIVGDIMPVGKNSNGYNLYKKSDVLEFRYKRKAS